jgi:hypothetical protein
MAPQWASVLDTPATPQISPRGSERSQGCLRGQEKDRGQLPLRYALVPLVPFDHLLEGVEPPRLRLKRLAVWISDVINQRDLNTFVVVGSFPIKEVKAVGNGLSAIKFKLKLITLSKNGYGALSIPNNRNVIS